MITSPVGINQDIVLPGMNGYLASTEDQWIEFLSILYKNVEIRELLGKNCKVTALEKYDISHAYSDIHKCIEELLNM